MNKCFYCDEPARYTFDNRYICSETGQCITTGVLVLKSLGYTCEMEKLAGKEYPGREGVLCYRVRDKSGKLVDPFSTYQNANLAWRSAAIEVAKNPPPMIQREIPPPVTAPSVTPNNTVFLLRSYNPKAECEPNNLKGVFSSEKKALEYVKSVERTPYAIHETNIVETFVDGLLSPSSGMTLYSCYSDNGGADVSRVNKEGTPGSVYPCPVTELTKETLMVVLWANNLVDAATRAAEKFADYLEDKEDSSSGS